MLFRVQRVMLWSAIALLGGSAVWILLSLLPGRWLAAPPVPPKPLAVELIVPARTALALPTRGMSIGRGGFGTILSAEARLLDPHSPPSAFGERTRAAEPPVATEVSRFVRLLARLAPSPPSDQLVNFNAEEPSPQFGTIILRDGCLKLAEAGEPHVIVPPGTGLHVDKEGFLTIAIPSNAAATNPRLGEAAWWPGGIRLPIAATSVTRIRAKCGPGAVRVVGPAQSVSAS